MGFIQNELKTIEGFKTMLRNPFYIMRVTLVILCRIEEILKK